MAIKYIDWRTDRWFHYKQDLQNEIDGIEFNEEVDDFVVFFNDENHKNAVYYKLAHGGCACCLAEHFDLWSRIVDTDDGFSDRIYNLFIAEVIDNGFPPVHPPIREYYTWRDLINDLKKFDDSVLDLPASVWIHDGQYMEGDHLIYPPSPSYGDDEPISKNNLLSVSTESHKKYGCEGDWK